MNNWEQHAHYLIEQALRNYDHKRSYMPHQEISKYIHLIKPRLEREESPGFPRPTIHKLCGDIELPLCVGLFEPEFGDVLCDNIMKSVIPKKITRLQIEGSGDAVLYKIYYHWCVNLIGQIDGWSLAIRNQWELVPETLIATEVKYLCYFGGKFFNSYETPEIALQYAFDHFAKALAPTEDPYD